MYRRITLKTVLASAALVGLTIWPAAAEFPEKPIQVVVPTQQGGSTDVMARIFQEAIQRLNLLPQPLVVANVTGAGGTVGTRQIKDAAADGYTIGVWHTGLVTSRAMEVTEYDHDAFEVIAQTGSIPLGLAVRDGAAIQTIEELVSEAGARPDEVRIATNIGLTVHFVPLIFQSEAGIRLRFVQTGGGSRRLQSILGDHTDVAIFSSQEFISYGPSGLKPIVLFADERHPQLPDLPTAKEKGYSLVWDEAFLWLAPKGTPQDVIDALANALETAFADPEVQQKFVEQAMNADFKGGAETTTMLDALRIRATEVAGTISSELEADTLPQ